MEKITIYKEYLTVYVIVLAVVGLILLGFYMADNTGMVNFGRFIFAIFVVGYFPLQIHLDRKMVSEYLDDSIERLFLVNDESLQAEVTARLANLTGRSECLIGHYVVEYLAKLESETKV